MEGEHFGMATAEMMRAGCLVFAHRSGGSLEVVDRRMTRCCGRRERRRRDAIVDAVAGHRQLRDALLARLREHAQRSRPIGS